MKKLVSVLLAAAMILCLVSCAKTGEGAVGQNTKADKTDTAAASEKTVYFGACNSWDTLDPFAPVIIQQMFLNSCYQTLGVYDSYGGEVHGALMKSWKAVDDYTYDIELYDYARDVDGNPFSADDVVFCFNKAKESGNFSKLNYMDSMTKTGDYSVRLVLNTNMLGAFEDVIMSVSLVTQKAYEESKDNMATTPVGTTQYKVVSCTTGSQLILEKVDDYWQTDESLIPDVYKANADKIVYDVIAESAQVETALMNGEIMMAWQTPAEIVDSFDGMEGYGVTQIDNTLSRCLMFNCAEGSVFADNLPLRQAVAYAIDKESCIEAAAAGKGVAATTAGSYAYGGYNSAWKDENYFDYDVETAKSLLAEAGYKEGELTLRLMIDSSSTMSSIADVVYANLKDIGINVDIRQYDGATYTSYRDASSGEYDLLVYSMSCTGQIVSAWAYIADIRLGNGSTTMYGVYDPDFQALIEKAYTVAGNTPENIEAIHDYLKDNCYIIGLFNDYKWCVHTDAIESPYIMYINGNAQVVPGASSLAG